MYHVLVWGRITYRVLVGKAEGKRSLETHRHRWENNIKMGIKETGCDGVDVKYGQVVVSHQQGTEPWIQ